MQKNAGTPILPTVTISARVIVAEKDAIVLAVSSTGITKKYDKTHYRLRGETGGRVKAF